MCGNARWHMLICRRLTSRQADREHAGSGRECLCHGGPQHRAPHSQHRHLQVIFWEGYRHPRTFQIIRTFNAGSVNDIGSEAEPLFVSGPSHGGRHHRGGPPAALRRLNRRLSTAGSMGHQGPSASLHPATLEPMATPHRITAERVDLPVALRGEPQHDCVLA